MNYKNIIFVRYRSLDLNFKVIKFDDLSTAYAWR